MGWEGWPLSMAGESTPRLSAVSRAAAREGAALPGGSERARITMISATRITSRMDRSIPIPPARIGGRIRRTGRSTGSVIRSRTRVIPVTGEPGRTGTQLSNARAIRTMT